MDFKIWPLAGLALPFFVACACSSDPAIDPGSSASGGTTGSGAGSGMDPGTGGGDRDDDLPIGGCNTRSCTERGWACGRYIDDCGNIVDCAEEGLTCEPGQICAGGIGSPTECRTGGVDGPCDLCSAIPDCSQAEVPTRLAGRVVTPGRDDDDTANQVGIPNAVVFILRNNDVTQLPAIEQGLPTTGTQCDRCEDRDLGPVLKGAVTDASGRFELEGNIPVGEEFLLVVQAGKFRRAVTMTLPAGAACEATALPEGLPDNPTRLPRHMDDGLAVHIPRIAVTTGEIDAMECVFLKMGLDAAEFGNPGEDGSAAARIHLYQGGATSTARSGAIIDGDTPYDQLLYGDAERLRGYDIVVANCEGQALDGDGTQRASAGGNVRDYVNRGGRMFVSHLSATWLDQNGDLPYAQATASETGLAAASTWNTGLDLTPSGTGAVSLPPYPNSSPRVEDFAAWLVAENVTTAPSYEFQLIDPRSSSTGPGDATEVFVHLIGGSERVQQFSFNTPYGAPEEAACGRVAYSGFHVAAAGGNNPFATAVFPNHCTGPLGNSGVLTDQEKVLLYMLFDLGACVGEDDPCVPATCEGLNIQCGQTLDNCGGILDCGACGVH